MISSFSSRAMIVIILCRGQLSEMTKNNIINMYFFKYEIFVFFSSRSLKTREKYISFAQFVYFLREVCLLFNF